MTKHSTETAAGARGQLGLALEWGEEGKAAKKRPGIVKHNCDYCGVEYEVPRAWLKYKHAYCGKACKAKADSGSRTGVAQPWHAHKRLPLLRQVPCVMCGKTFERPRRAGWVTCCSDECKQAHRRQALASHVKTPRPRPKGKEVLCETCGKPFWVVPSVPRRHCSRKCFNASQLRQVDRVCVICGVAFSVPESRIRRGDPVNCCSKVCWQSWIRTPMNPLWKGGITRAKTQWGTSREGLAFRRGCKKRDAYTCQICGETLDPRSKRLHAHHKAPWIEYPALQSVLENGVTVCRTCHVEAGGLHSTEGEPLRAQWEREALEQLQHLLPPATPERRQSCQEPLAVSGHTR